jgi:hypothetical protein
MKTVSRIAACLLCVVLHGSGTPNSTIDSTDPGLCLSFVQAEARGLDVEEMREEFMASVDVFPGKKPEIADAWTELQHEIRNQLEASGVDGLGGNAMFSIVFFEPDGRIVRVIHRGLDPEQERILCEVVERLAEDYRFPLHSEVPFSQCGTTRFAEK